MLAHDNIDNGVRHANSDKNAVICSPNKVLEKAINYHSKSTVSVYYKQAM